MSIHNHHIHAHGGGGDQESHHHDIAQANRHHFDKTAKDFDSIPYAISRGERCAEAIRKEYVFDKDMTTVMEYACGTGLVSGNLAPYVKAILGVDISQGVVDLFNKRFADRDQERFRAIRAELKGEDGELDNEKFDVIIVRKRINIQKTKNTLTNTAIRIYSALQRITISKTLTRSLDFWLIS